MEISLDTRREIYRFLYSLNQQKYVTQIDGSSLLHLSVDKKSSADEYFIDRTCKYDIEILPQISILSFFLPFSFSDIHVCPLFAY